VSREIWQVTSKLAARRFEAFSRKRSGRRQRSRCKVCGRSSRIRVGAVEVPIEAKVEVKEEPEDVKDPGVEIKEEPEDVADPGVEIKEEPEDVEDPGVEVEEES